MKKLFILVLVLLMGIMGTASASKSRFKDPNYSFSNIMNVYLAECTYAPKSNQPHDLQEDSNPTGRALNSLRTAMAKKNKNLIVPPDEPTRARLDLHLTVHTLATYTYWKEPWFEEVAYAEVEFTLKDRSTGRTVYNCIDTRERQDSGYDGMLNRICNDFVGDIK